MHGDKLKVFYHYFVFGYPRAHTAAAATLVRRPRGLRQVGSSPPGCFISKALKRY